MKGTKADIIAQLQKDILPLQGIGTTLKNAALDTMLGEIKNAFPHASFPLGAIHEFITNNPEDIAATYGFMMGIISTLMRNSGALIWISGCRTIFPPALKLFGIPPERVIFINLQKEKEILWAMEESLKCKGLSAVISEMQELDFTASRRMQLAVEQSKVTGFVVRKNAKSINITACLTRWKITSLKSELFDEMPGIGFPRWNVELIRARNGTPGKWEIEFVAGRFRQVSKTAAIPFIQKKKTG
jgi:protein ImuA